MVKPKKSTQEVAMEERLMACYAAATPEETAAVTALVAKAIRATRSAEVVRLTPGMCAKLFYDHNRQNRAWSWSATAAYEREARADQWRFTSQGIGMVASGDVGDGQHRLAAWALSGLTVEVTVTFGMAVEDVDHLDIGKGRQPADSLHILMHMDQDEAKLQAGVLRSAWPYLVQCLPGTVPARRPYEFAALVKTHQPMILEAIEIGGTSVTGHAKPTVKKREARILAFILRMSGWPREVIEAKLQHLQRGEDVGENSPFFLAAKLLDRQSKVDDLKRLNSRFAVIIKAFQADEKGMKAMTDRALRTVAKEPKEYPNPTYPTSAEATS